MQTAHYIRPVTSEQLSRFRPVVRRVACCMMRGLGNIDNQAKGVDDYESDLMITAWEATLKWRDTRGPERPKEEERYVNGAIWNAARSFERSRDLKKYDAIIVPDALEKQTDDTLQDQLEARDALQVLQRKLPEKQ